MIVSYGAACAGAAPKARATIASVNGVRVRIPASPAVASHPVDHRPAPTPAVLRETIASALARGVATFPSVAPTTSSNAAPRLSRFETLGAWLHVWTPPRDAVVPPVPWRRIAVGAAIAAAILGGLAAWLVPRINQAKHSHAAAERRAAAAVSTRERRILERDQRLHSGRAASRPADPLAAQRAVVADLARTITSDAA